MIKLEKTNRTYLVFARKKFRMISILCNGPFNPRTSLEKMKESFPEGFCGLIYFNSFSEKDDLVKIFEKVGKIEHVETRLVSNQEPKIFSAETLPLFQGFGGYLIMWIDLDRYKDFLDLLRDIRYCVYYDAQPQKVIIR